MTHVLRLAPANQSIEGSVVKYNLFVIGITGICAMSGCVADSPDVQRDPSHVEQVATSDIVANAVGAFQMIRLTNTQWCLQPAGGSVGEALIELHGCDTTSAAQHWLLTSTPNGTTLLNQNSGLCLRNNAPVPPADGGTPILQDGCFVSGTTTPASNSLWSPVTSGGDTMFVSRVQFRNTGFCLDVPNGDAHDHATLQIFHCNQTAAQRWVVE